MIIGFDAKRYYHNRTGLGNYSRRMVNGLASFFPQDSLLLYDSYPPHPLPSAKNILNGSYSGYWPHYWRRRGIASDIQKDGIQVYHGLSNELPWAKLTGIKKVVTIHDIIFKIYPHFFPVIDRKIYDLKTSQACSAADIIIAVSMHTAKDLMHYYQVPENKIVVIYPPLYPSISANENNTENYWLYVGTVEERKDIYTLIKAYRESRMELPLWIVGRGGSYLHKMKALSKNWGLANRIFFKEDISLEALPQLYQSALAVIYPSRYEGFGMPVAEALQYGKTVITTSSSSLTEAGGDAALYFNAGQYAELAVMMKEVMHGLRMSPQKIKAQIARFSPENTILPVRKIYE